MTITQVPEVYFGKSLGIHIHMCLLNCFSCVWLFATLWTVVHQAPLSMGLILQAKILDWVAIPSCRGSSPPKDGTGVSFVSYIGRWVFLFFGVFLTTSATWEAHTCACLYVNDITWHKIAHTHTTLSYLYIYIYLSTCITTYTWFLYITISPSINYTPTFFFLLSSSMIKL